MEKPIFFATNPLFHRFNPSMATSIRHTQVLAFVWRYTRRHTLGIAVMCVLMVTYTFLTLAQPFFYRAAVDIIAEGVVGDIEALKRALMMIFYGVLFGIMSLTLHEVASYMIGHIEARTMSQVHADVFARVQRLSTKFHVNSFAGATTRKIGRGVDGVESVMDRIWFNFLPLGVFTIGLTIVLINFAPIIGVAMLGGMALYTAVSIILNMFLAKYYSLVDRQDTRVTASMVDTISANSLVKTFSAEEREDVRHGGILNEWRHRLLKSWRLSAIVTWIQFMLLMAIELMVLSLTVYLWYRGQFTAGGFIVIMFYVGQLWGRLHDIGRNMRDYMKAVANCEEMVSIAYRPIEIEDHPEAKPLHMQRGNITFCDVSFRYENQTNPVFDSFNLAIEPGEKIAFVGYSGGGKSTLIKLLLRLYDLDSGSIKIDGQDIAEVTQETLRHSMSLVPQDPILFHRTIAENIAYASPDASEEEIKYAAKLAHAHEFIKELPQRYDTLVGERGVKLSGGERQRVAIARAILADKPILLLDEATSSLDSVSEKYIQEALHSLMEDRTTIVIAHRLGTVRTVDRIAVLEKGKLIACAPHEELMKTCKTYSEMVELQSQGMLGG